MKISIFILSILILLYSDKLYSNYYLGPYMSAEAGQMIYTQSSSNQIHNNYLIGGGLIFQTLIHRRGLYNYRLNLGFEKIYIPHTTKLGTDFSDTYRGNLFNTIAYSIYKRKNYNLWIGPQIGLHILRGYKYLNDSKSNKYTMMLISSMVDPILQLFFIDYPFINRYEKINDFIFSFAPEIGVDLNLTDIVILSLESGLRVGIHLPINKSNSTGTLYRFEGYINLSFLFRINKEETT